MRGKKNIIGVIALFAVLALIVGILMQTQVVNANQPVTRSFKCQGQLTVLDVLDGSPWTVVDVNEMSHLGKVIGAGKWSSLPPDLAIGKGIMYAANGDQIFWEQDGYGIDFTGGTGRFENVSGGYTLITFTDEIWYWGPSGTLNVTQYYEGEGTITY